MGVDLSLKAIPKFGKRLIDKSELRKGTEYSNLLFHTFSAFQNEFCDFGNPDWIEFKNDARTLLPYFNDENYFEKFDLDTNRTYEALDYLIIQFQESKNFEPVEFRNFESFYYAGIECDFCRGGQGFILKYWDFEIIKKKKEIIDQLSFNELYGKYNEADMIRQGVYKMEQIKNSPREKLKMVFDKTKIFLADARELGGYVLVCKD
ncbi:MAG: DUF1877 family protein [Saprospiraceae bacterium]